MSFKLNKNKGYVSFILVFAILLIARLSIQGKGYLDDTDELPFLVLLDNYDQLIVLNPHAWNVLVFDMWSNYVEITIRLVQAAVLKVYADWKSIPASSTEALIVMGMFNVLVSMLISLMFYKILRRLKFKQVDALLGMFLAGTLLNTNLYTRHILPYETSLLFHLISIYLLLVPKLNKRIVLTAGVFCAVGYFNYYGNFLLLFIAWTLLMYRVWGRYRVKFTYTLLLSIPSVALLFFFEWVSSLSSQSYIAFQFLFSTTIFHGSLEEGLVYIFKYFSLVETPWGMFLLLLSTMGILYSLFYKEVVPTLASRLFQISVLFYLLYGLQAVLAGKMVFYGRVLHLFYPFMALGVLIMVNVYPKIRWICFTGAFINLFFVVQDLNSIGYPRSITYQLGLFSDLDEYKYVNELKPVLNYNYRERFIDQSFEGIPEISLQLIEQNANYAGSHTLLNFAFFFHYPDSFMETYEQFIPKVRQELIFSKPHFMSHPAYTFEYCTMYGRSFFLEKKFKIEVYSAAVK